MRGRSAGGSRKRARHDAWIGAGEAGRENFDHQRGADPLVAAGGRHRPRQCRRGIGGRLSLGANAQPSGIGSPARARFMTSLLATTLALWSMTKRAPPSPSGTASDHGIGAERRLPGAPGRDRGGRVGEAERDHARLRQALGVIAQHAAIIGIADREARDAIGYGGGDQRGQTKVDGGMREARTRVDDEACRRRSR